MLNYDTKTGNKMGKSILASRLTFQTNIQIEQVLNYDFNEQ